MYAIIETGGKQYRVQQGDIIYVEKLSLQPDEEIVFEPLLMGDKTVKIGSPTVRNAEVRARVVNDVRGEKIIVYKYKAKKNYRKKTGHRQPYTKIEILSVGNKKKAAPAQELAAE